ncbi:MAG: methyltransferase domain-containing protein [Rhodothermales bacterium]|nr:methyltransferase domain-containing protein [Rhodothermales bacterium]MBO6778200.1 methyltransferase domain-containing protein [Rhodothermales bacterium]
MKTPSWRKGLLGKGGFWQNGYWYDLHVERRIPLVMPMLEEILAALPPLGPGVSVCDLGCGTGNAGFAVMSAYPGIRLTLLDRDEDLLVLAQSKLAEISDGALAIRAEIRADGEAIPGGPFDVVVASLALQDIVGADIEGAEAESHYELLFQGIFDALNPGGHLIVADGAGTIGLYRQMKAMERAGFMDVDCAWRQNELFVCGGRTPE